MRQKIIQYIGATLCASLISTPVFAQSTAAAIKNYPDKPIKLVIPYPPGGATDVIGRIMAQELSKTLNQQVVPDNRAGDSGNIGGNSQRDIFGGAVRHIGAKSAGSSGRTQL